MNSQIEKFARECGAWHQVYADRNFMIDEHFDIKKFAELIVRECCQKLEDDGMVEIAIEMKQHFGL